MGSALSQYYPPKPTWTAADIPDLTGKVVLVTGGNTGIGKETCKALLAKNAKVYLAARSAAKAQAAIDDLAKLTGNTALFLQLDLGSLASVRQAAEGFMSKETSLHILMCNAGVMAPPIDQLTQDGYDLQFGTNVLGHFFLVQLLLPTLIATAERSSAPSRVVITSSSVQSRHKGPIRYETFKDGMERKKMGTFPLYCQSKFANIMQANELARLYGDKGIVVTSLDPGNIQSDLQRHFPKWAVTIMNLLILYPTEYGAITQLYVATSPEAASLNGKFLVPWARIGTPLDGTRDEEECRKLWTWLERQVEGK